jgi:hypothetical protein
MLAVSQDIAVARWLRVVPRLGAGLVLGQVRDPVTGTAATDGAPVPVQVIGADDSSTTTRVVVEPEIGIVAPWRSFELGVALGLALFPGSGVATSAGLMEVAPSCPASNPGAVGCSPASSLLAGERVFGPIAVWVPRVSIAYVF